MSVFDVELNGFNLALVSQSPLFVEQSQPSSLSYLVNFGDLASAQIFTLSGQTIESVMVNVEVPFDCQGRLKIGDALNLESIFTAEWLDITEPGQVTIYPSFAVNQPTQIIRQLELDGVAHAGKIAIFVKLINQLN